MFLEGLVSASVRHDSDCYSLLISCVHLRVRRPLSALRANGFPRGQACGGPRRRSGHPHTVGGDERDPKAHLCTGGLDVQQARAVFAIRA